MNAQSYRLSNLGLRFDVLESGPDYPVVTVLVDGEDPFQGVAKGWRGFDPAKILGPDSPLIPDDTGGRVAVYTCSCGIAGCGVLAPLIVPSPDRTRISWVDFRDYVGVFVGPVAPGVADHEGRPWPLPDIHFEREQYLGEIRRMVNDRSWETPRRTTARLVEERLLSVCPVLPLDLTLRWVGLAGRDLGVTLSFERSAYEAGSQHHVQQLLQLDSAETDPSRAADAMIEQLLATDPQEWVRRFAYDARRGRQQRS